jgi:hypothetical protein
MTARRALLAAAIVCILVAVYALRPAPTSGPRTRDFEAYWSAGRTLLAGDDPYGRAIWNAERTVPGVDPRHDELLPFVDPPAALLLFSLFARLPYADAARLWWIVLALALLALVWLVLRDGGARPSPLLWLCGTALAIGFGPVTSDLALGQIALLAVFGAAAAVATPEQVAGSFLAFLQPNVALGLASQLRRGRATAGIIAGAGLAYLAGAAAAGWGWPARYARLVAAHGAAERFAAIQFSPAALAYGLGASPRASSLAGAAVAVLAVAAAVVLARRIHDDLARFAAISALVPLVAGFFHEHDFTLALVGALWCALRIRGRSRAIALAATLLVAVDWLGLAQRPAGIAQSAFQAAAALCAFTALGPRIDWRASLAAGLPTATLFAAAAWLAVHHPAPVWPDSLGAFHAPPSLPVARVWYEEQRRSGLLAAVPAWSLLRCLPLLGCAILALSVYRRSSSDRTASTPEDSIR